MRGRPLFGCLICVAVEKPADRPNLPVHDSLRQGIHVTEIAIKAYSRVQP